MDRHVCDRSPARDLLGRGAGRQPVASAAQRRTGHRDPGGRRGSAPGRSRSVVLLLGVLRRDRRPRLLRPLPRRSMILSDWSRDPSLVYVVLAGWLYVLGSRARDRPAPLHALSFFAGLLTIVIALDSPIDRYADQLFWVHMLQHILLLTVAPPLFLLARPWPRMWRALPLETRTSVARTVANARWTSPIRALSRPLPAWLLFCATIVGWHIPGAYDSTLTSGTVH